MGDKKKILVFIDYYLPGYKGGGPVNTLSNMVNLLSKENDFYIVTRDRDLGDIRSYPNIECNKWLPVGGGNVMYLSPDSIKLGKIYEIIKGGKWEKIYLNSFFSRKFSISIVLLGKVFGFDIPILLSPKGEFSRGALKLKPIRKKLYILLAKIFKLYKNVVWHLTDSFELEALRKVFDRDLSYKIAKDPVCVDINSSCREIIKTKGMLNLVFISRISRKKNLDICLKILGQLDNAITFDIYGPIEDSDYWHYCCSLVSTLPPYVKVKYCGEVSHDEIYDAFSKYHMLFLPTAGENFGYIIFESLLSGRPVLIGSDTPWKDLASKNLGADISPDDVGSFVREINKFIQMDQDDFNKVAEDCRNYAIFICNEEEQKAAVRGLFN